MNDVGCILKEAGLDFSAIKGERRRFPLVEQAKSTGARTSPAATLCLGFSYGERDTLPATGSLSE
jgi:hypothetical protein